MASWSGSASSCRLVFQSTTRKPPSGSLVDRVDPAADHLAVEHQRERRLDGERHPVGERALLERRDHRVEVALVGDVEVGAARAGRRGRAAAAARSGPRPRRGTGCRTGRPGWAAAASAGPARGRTRRRRPGAAAARSPTGCRAAAPRSRGLRSERASASSRSSSASQSATRALSTMSRSSSSAVGSAARTSAAASSRRCASAPMPVGRPGPRRVLGGVGVGVALGRGVEPAVDRLAPLLELLADEHLVGRGPERRRAAGSSRTTSPRAGARPG